MRQRLQRHTCGELLQLERVVLHLFLQLGQGDAVNRLGAVLLHQLQHGNRLCLVVQRTALYFHRAGDVIGLLFPADQVVIFVVDRLNAQVVPGAGLVGLRVHNGGLLVKRRRFAVIGRLGNGLDFPALMRDIAVYVRHVPVVGRHRNAVGLFRLTIQRRDGKGIAVGQVAHRAVGPGVLVHRGPLHRKAAQLQQGLTALDGKLGVVVQVDFLRVNGIAKCAFRFGSVHGGVQRDGRQLCLCGILQDVEPVRRCPAVGGHNAHRGQQVLFCMVGRQRKAVAVGHKGIAGGFVVDAGAPAHRAAVFRDDQLGVAAGQHLVQCFGQLLLGLILGLSGAFALPSLGQFGNF